MQLQDLVKTTFLLTREMARKRGGRVPDLSRQGTLPVPKRSAAALGAPTTEALVPGLQVGGFDGASISKKGPGRPTGLDGRAIPRRMRVSSFNSLVGREIKRREWSENMAYGWVIGNWETLVGAKIAQHTTVHMIKDGEVHIECDTTAWATQLKYMQSTVLRLIADKVGPEVVTKLHIYGPKTPSWRKGPLHVKGRGPRDTYG